MSPGIRRACLGLMPWALVLDALAQGSPPIEPPGFRPRPPAVHALVGAKVVSKPGSEWSSATIVIRDGRIVASGPEVRPPAEARVWDLTGMTVYPGFIDPYVMQGGGGPPAGMNRPGPSGAGSDGLRAGTGTDVRYLGVPGEESDPGVEGPGAGIPDVTPERRVAPGYVPDAKLNEGLREQGFTVAQLIPSRGILRGQSALVSLGTDGPNRSVLRADVAQCVAMMPIGFTPGYPDSVMGTIAVIRQTWLDARWHESAKAAGAGSRPYNVSLAALTPTFAAGGRQPVIIEPGSVLLASRGLRLAGELGFEAQMVASGQEWRRPELFRGTKVPFITSLAYPSVPKLTDEADWDAVPLDLLRQWDWAPENPVVLRREGVEIALTTHGLSDRGEFRKNLKRALDRGLTETDALAALTTVPARLCGVSAELGAIEAGRLAHLTVVAGSYFDPAASIRAVWVDGVPHEFPAKPTNSVAKVPAAGTNAVPNVGSTGTNAVPNVGAAGTNGVANAVTNAVAGTNAVVGTNAVAGTNAPAGGAGESAAKGREADRQRVARSPRDDGGAITNPPALLVRNAVVWTCGPAGTISNASVFVRGGRIESVGAEPATLPEGTLVVDAAGRHVTPGLIDCHSHSMIFGGVNEGTLPSTAMVRIADVVNSEAETIHQQLAGGLTMANQLHGSANPIGGQNCVIKLRLGAGPDGLVFTNAPAGIKFALGENVKQSGNDRSTRFPQSRMGVGTFYVNRFTAARQYAEEWAAYEAGGRQGVSPRRDLEMEALVEILAGTRLIHCHSYRQDEIVAFLRVMESFGVRVATLQHVLEGYKVADEIARHGAGASAFSDWWAYKFEVIDAIPHAGSILHQRGVVVSFNSDENDHARRLNLEAAKAVKYGGTSETDALRFVTLNPARQLRVDRWVGSLESGKDADLVLWSGHPLDTASRCDQTWIEGTLYFDRAREKARVAAMDTERRALLAKARKTPEKADKPGKEPGAPPGPPSGRELFFIHALERARHLGVSECQDCERSGGI